MDSDGRTVFVVDAHRDDGKRFVVRADEKLTAFLEVAIGRAESPVVGSGLVSTREFSISSPVDETSR
jgi:hypothetical protein